MIRYTIDDIRKDKRPYIGSKMVADACGWDANGLRRELYKDPEMFGADCRAVLIGKRWYIPREVFLRKVDGEEMPDEPERTDS